MGEEHAIRRHNLRLGIAVFEGHYIQLPISTKGDQK